MNTMTTPPRHWTREPWPWILMGLPASAVVAGSVTLWLALQTNNSLVVDDYYKEGKAINQRIARDELAAHLGLSAGLTLADGRVSVRLTGGLVQLPAALGLRFVHLADARHDAVAIVHADGSGGLSGAVAAMAPGHYRIHIEPPEADWRLVSEVVDIGQGGLQTRIDSGRLARYRIGGGS